MHEKRAGISMKSKKINSFTASNNQLLFNLLTIFGTLLLLHPQCFRDMLVSDVLDDGQERQPTSHCPGGITEIQLRCPGGQHLIKSRQCNKCLLPCHIRVVRVCDGAMKIGWLTSVGAIKN